MANVEFIDDMNTFGSINTVSLALMNFGMIGPGYRWNGLIYAVRHILYGIYDIIENINILFIYLLMSVGAVKRLITPTIITGVLVNGKKEHI